MNTVYVLILVGWMNGFVMSAVEGVYESEESCFWAMQDSLEAIDPEPTTRLFDGVCLELPDEQFDDHYNLWYQ